LLAQSPSTEQEAPVSFVPWPHVCVDGSQVVPSSHVPAQGSFSPGIRSHRDETGLQ
jgi:hypothetical protein